MFELKSLKDRIWFRSLFFFITAICSILLIPMSMYTIDLKVNNSEYLSLFIFLDLLLLVIGIFFMISGYRIQIY
jgi:hypothetical protein